MILGVWSAGLKQCSAIGKGGKNALYLMLQTMVSGYRDGGGQTTHGVSPSVAYPQKSPSMLADCRENPKFPVQTGVRAV